jgi:2-polyprenyl-3-methyl-5-hydroxy-6-metoxy-1,4-benzoquinol methylase
MAEAEVVNAIEQAGGVVFDVRPESRGGPTIKSLDYVVAKSGARRGLSAGMPALVRPEHADPVASRISFALDAARAGQVASETTEIARLDTVARDASASLQREVHTLMDRGDLVGFGLTSRRTGVGRLSVLVRRVLRRMMFQILHRQTQFNRVVTGLFEKLATELDLMDRLPHVNYEMLGRAEARIQTLERAQAQARETNAELARGLARSELRFVMLARQLRAPVGLDAGEDPMRQPGLDYMSLTNRFRGTREEIRSRQKRYLRHFADRSDVLDVGCGRGEFLELLREEGIEATGIDHDQDMVADCQRRGLTVFLADAMDYLANQPVEALGGIFAAQVIEHLPSDHLIRLVRLAFARLRPGGVMLLETINPACLFALSNFYLDPTHTRPVHPETLRWLAESAGFVAEVEYVTPVEEPLRLTPLPSAERHEAGIERFNRGIHSADQLLFGHQEYALIAHKPR